MRQLLVYLARGRRERWGRCFPEEGRWQLGLREDRPGVNVMKLSIFVADVPASSQSREHLLKGKTRYS
jgi:hypothetical protein